MARVLCLLGIPTLLLGLGLALAIPPARAADPEAADAAPDEIARLVRALGSESWEEREAATERLAAIGRAAHAALEAALESEDAEVRYRARLVLRASLRKVTRYLDLLTREGGSPNDPAFKALLEMGVEAVDPLAAIIERELGDNDGKNEDRVRVALRVLERMASPAAVEPMLRLLGLNIQRFHGAVGRVLRRSAPGPARAGLKRRLTERDPLVRRNAVEVLGQFPGDEAAAALAGALGDPDASVRAEAVKGLARSAAGRGPGEARAGAGAAEGGATSPAAMAAARDAILRATDDPDRSVQVRALGALARLGDRRIVPRLREIVAAAVADDRLVAAVAALGTLDDRDSIPTLLPLLGSERGDVVEVAVRTLGAMRARDAVPGLVKLLDAEEAQGHAVALRALGEIGDPRAFEPLRAYYSSKTFFESLAIEAIGRLPGPGPRAFLVDRVRRAKDEGEVRVALERLEELPADELALGDDEDLMGAALAALERHQPGVRVVALRIIGRARFRPAFDDVAKLVAVPDHDTRSVAIETIGQMRDPRGKDLLRPLLKKGETQTIRQAAEFALVQLGDEETLGTAIGARETAMANRPNDRRDQNHLGILYIYKRDFDKALAAFEALFKQDERDEIAAYNIACTQSLAGRPDEAIKWLEKARDLSFDDWKHMESDTDLDPIRALPGYKDVLGRMRQGERGRSGRAPEPIEIEFDPDEPPELYEDEP